jgi:hypothetical protein
MEKDISLTDPGVIDKAMDLAHKAMLKHKRMHNAPVVISRNGRIIYLDPFTIPDERKGDWSQAKELPVPDIDMGE